MVEPVDGLILKPGYSPNLFGLALFTTAYVPAEFSSQLILPPSSLATKLRSSFMVLIVFPLDHGYVVETGTNLVLNRLLAVPLMSMSSLKLMTWSCIEPELPSRMWNPYSGSAAALVHCVHAMYQDARRMIRIDPSI